MSEPTPATDMIKPEKANGGRILLLLLPCAAASITLAVVYVYLVEPWIKLQQVRGQVIVMPLGPSGMMSTPFVWPGIRQPPCQSAADCRLEDDHEVIGISAKGKHRAYSVAALNSMIGHIVNDVVADVPITVTYCNFSKCTKVFTADRTGPLDVWLFGIDRGQMMLKIDNSVYFQETGQLSNPDGDDAKPFPFQQHQFMKTTWKEWRTAHPDTDVYVGLNVSREDSEEFMRTQPRGATPPGKPAVPPQDPPKQP